jgi:hypothetical protein
MGQITDSVAKGQTTYILRVWVHATKNVRRIYILKVDMVSNSKPDSIVEQQTTYILRAPIKWHITIWTINGRRIYILKVHTR